MLRSRTRWEFKKIDEEEIAFLAKKTKLHPLVVRLCWLRGVRTADEMDRFLNIESNTFHDPFLMKGMKEAVERIKSAIAADEQILVYGDYDADGVSSTTILHHLLSRLGARFNYYIPDRFNEGYGLNIEAVEKAAEAGISLIVTVDTGITAYAEVERAKELGIDVIITDHHEPPEEIPRALAVINPKQQDCDYPFPYLCGAGVALKLAQALLGEVPEEWLGIAAIGTIADVVPLIDENRLIAFRGLRALTHSNHVGIRALLKESGIEDEVLTSFHIGFAVGPRINAGGRLERADLGVRLLTTDNREEAVQLAKQLNRLNQERQELVKQIYEEAELQAAAWLEQGLGHVLVVAGEEWNEGVIGIVASRLVEKYYRPTIVLSIDKEKGTAKGSARSIEGFDLFANLTECQEMLVKYGGHRLAAGLSISLEEIEPFRVKINTLAKKKLTEEQLYPKTEVDIECRLEDVTLSLLEQISRLAPFGASNPEPVICIKDVEISSMRKVGRDGEHLKWTFKQNDHILEAIGFRLGQLEEWVSPYAKLDVIGEISINEWNGVRKPQLLVKDFAIHQLQIFDHRGIRNRLEHLVRLPLNEYTAILYFRPENQRDLEEFVKGTPISLYAISQNGLILSAVNKKCDSQISQIVLYDLPFTFRSLRAIQELHKVERIWSLFGTEINEQRLRKIPDREAFKWLYSYFYTHKTVAFDMKIWEIGRRKGFSKEELMFMVQVFKELQFIKEEEGYYSLINNPKKQSFEHSITYRREKERIEVETELVFSSIHDLSKWLTHSREDWNELKEATVR
jgi:single-stranded-DNA-specific exonuclease